VTAQTPESILLDGEEWLLLGTPLDPFLAANGLANRFVSPHTALWRGYLGTWRVDAEGHLFLDDVTATVRALGSGTQTVQGSAALRGAALPMAADFVTGRLRVARGAQVRHVHSDFDSVWEQEVLLEVERGRVLSRQTLAEPSAMGSAGPYRLHEPLLGNLSGGGFGQVIAATDLDGRSLVAKVPLPRGGGNRTEMWMDTPAGRRPVHVPAQVFRGGPEQSRSVEVGPEVTAAVLRREADILERDGGRLLPRSLGVWQHDPSGLDVLVMERLVGRPPATPADVAAVLEALAGAVDRGTFETHGDVKREHVFITEGSVRICDPAPRFDDPQLRGLTPAYNPRGFSGPAADVAACASLLRYLPDAARTDHAGWRWCAAVLDDPAPPPWIHSHRAALHELRHDLDGPPAPPPPGWSVPPIPDGLLPADDPSTTVPVTRPPAPLAPGEGERYPTVDVMPSVPPGWLVKVSWTVFSPDGQANVIASSEPLSRSMSTEEYMAIQGDLLRSEFRHYREFSLAPVRIGHHQAWLREFSWAPPDGVEVTQFQLYYVLKTAEGQRGLTATATTPSVSIDRFRQVFLSIIGSLRISGGTAG
jgi:hypothetical protein